MKYKKKNIQLLEQKDKEYKWIKHNTKLSEIRYQIHSTLLEMSSSNLPQKTISISSFLHQLDYFYIFLTPHFMVYFSRYQEGKDCIYFEGVSKIQDIQKISFLKSIQHGYLELQKDALVEKGSLFQISPQSIHLLHNDISLYSSFKLIKKEWYLKKRDKYEMMVEGYSLGGVYSQLFLFELMNRGKIEKYKIGYMNVESWFMGDEKRYKKLKESVEYKNILNQNSVMYFYNQLFQEFHQVNKKVGEEKWKLRDFLTYMAPFGCMKYIVENHVLSNL
jgi:hypothetical protein